MRKIFSLTTVSVLALFFAVQPLDAQGLGIGVEAGLNVSDLSVDTDVDGTQFDAETGFRAGGVLRYDFAPVIGIQTGASYSQKGAAFSNDIGTSQEIELEYVEVPLLLQLNIPTGPAPVNPRLFAGGTLNFEIACDQMVSSATVDGSGQCSAEELGDFAFDTKSTDIGFLFGGGLDFPAGPGALTVDVRFDLGLSDINDVAEDAVGDPAELKNRNFQATAGYVVSLP